MSGTGLPPGPSSPAIVQTLRSVIDPVAFAAECHRRFGPVCTIRVHPVGPVVCVADGPMVRELVSGDPAVFRAGEANSVLEFVVGPRSVLLLDGAEHTRRRRVLLPPFRGRQVRTRSPQVEAIAGRMVAAWPVGREFPVQARMAEVTLEVMMASVLGIRDAAELATLRRDLPALLHMNPALMLVPALRRDLGRHSPGGRLARLQRRVDDVLLGEIARRRRAPAARDDGDGDGDVLSLLLDARDEDGTALDDRELRDHLVTLLAVGHETTATALSWCVDLVLRHPRVRARLADEIATGGHTYTDAVLKESLRVRPVIGDIARTLAAPATVGGYDVPAGTMVALSLALTHRDPRGYPDPHAFRPERFLTTPPPMPFLPFGGGPHRCLGATFAMMTMRAVITSVFGLTGLRATGSRPERARTTGPVLTPSRGVPVIVDPVPVAAAPALSPSRPQPQR